MLAIHLDDHDLTQVKQLLLDYAAVALVGSTQVWGTRLANWAANCGGSGKSTLLGVGTKTTAGTAALVNGTSAHGYELDDTHERSFTHPGAVVISAVLAVAEETGASGMETCASIAAGYELMTRLGMAARSGLFLAKGYHPTCLLGPFGAATAAARLYGSDAEELARSWGIALSMTGGSMQFSYEPDADMVKRMHAGIPAQHGVQAAQLAGVGVTAPLSAIEGEKGFLNLFSDGPRPERLNKQVDTKLEIHDVSFKPYACCRLFHAVIDALEQPTHHFSLDTALVSRIKVGLPEGSVSEEQMTLRPDSIMSAQYSLPYSVGAALAYGPMRYDAFGDGYLQDERILYVADRVETFTDESLEGKGRRRMAARVRLELGSGETREGRVDAALGSPERPLGDQGLTDKVETLLASCNGKMDFKRLINVVDEFEKLDDVTPLVSLLGTPVSS